MIFCLCERKNTDSVARIYICTVVLFLCACMAKSLREKGVFYTPVGFLFYFQFCCCCCYCHESKQCNTEKKVLSHLFYYKCSSHNHVNMDDILCLRYSTQYSVHTHIHALKKVLNRTNNTGSSIPLIIQKRKKYHQTTHNHCHDDTSQKLSLVRAKSHTWF